MPEKTALNRFPLFGRFAYRAALRMRKPHTHRLGLPHIQPEERYPSHNKPGEEDPR